MGIPLEAQRIEAALAALDPALDTLGASKALRRALGPDLARRASELRELRRRARGRFPGAERGWLTPKGLEQTSHPAAAAFRAQAIAGAAGGERVLDGTSGLGADALALAAAGAAVVAADRDPRLAACAAWNARSAGLTVPVLVADVLTPAVRAAFLVADPDRRPAGTRELDPERGSPPLSALAARLGAFRGAALKLAPGLDVERATAVLPADLAHAWQWVSAGGELREVVLWTGALAGGPEREAVVLGEGDPARFAGVPSAVQHLAAPRAAEVPYVAEPDPALVRSGLLGRFAELHGLAPLGPGLAFLGAERPLASPFLRVHEVLGSSPADPKRVRALLAAHDVGPVVVTKRGHPETAEQLARRFRGRGARRGRLLVARLERGHRAYLVSAR